MEEEVKEDIEVEGNAVKDLISSTISAEQGQYLLERLENDSELASILDTILTRAVEFSGTGPVEGEGTPTSDEVPARLSDGEFVFSAKATQVIGPETLMQMMQEAEAAADNVEQDGTPQESAPTEESLIQRPQPRATLL